MTGGDWDVRLFWLILAVTVTVTVVLVAVIFVLTGYHPTTGIGDRSEQTLGCDDTQIGAARLLATE